MKGVRGKYKIEDMGLGKRDYLIQEERDGKN